MVVSVCDLVFRQTFSVVTSGRYYSKLSVFIGGVVSRRYRDVPLEAKSRRVVSGNKPIRTYSSQSLLALKILSKKRLSFLLLLRGLRYHNHMDN